MKLNKKIAVPFLSTVMGLSLIGGVGGAVAWYQYNSRVTASFIGTSVANTGVLQIGQKVASPRLYPADYEDEQLRGTQMEDQYGNKLWDYSMVWGRDLNNSTFTGSVDSNKLSPVTFGALQDDPDHDGAQKVYTGRLPSKAYTSPEAGKGPYQLSHVENAGTEQETTVYEDNWKVATAGKEYVQFDIYLRALQPDSSAVEDTANQIPSVYKLIEKDVYLSQVVLENAVNGKTVDEALRVHLGMNKGEGTSEKNILISKSGKQTTLSGSLDLDADGQPDKVGGWAWSADKDTDVVYGNAGDVQSPKSAASVVQSRDAAVDTTKMICKTSSDKTKEVKITVTVWLEGWAALDTGKVYPDDYSVENLRGTPIYSSLWDPSRTAGYDVHVGLEFDVLSF